MSTRIQQAQLIQSPEFLLQLTGSLVAAAAQIVNEAPSTADHANRLNYARAIIGNPTFCAQQFAPGVLTNATVAGEAGNAVGASGTPVPDSDLDYVVSSLFNVYADQYAAQANIGVVLQLGS